MGKAKSFFIKNLGCSKNKTDASAIEDALLSRGYVRSQTPDGSDLIVVNTCGFTQEAREQSLAAFFELHAAKKPSAKIVMAGCLSQMFHKEISKELKEADALLGNYDISRLDRLIDDLEDSFGSNRHRAGADADVKAYGVAFSAFNAPSRPKSSGERRISHIQPKALTAPVLDSPSAIYLKIAEGCDNMCSFCSIPIIRGKFRSFDEESILKSLRQAVSDGACEVNIVAQDLLSYGTDKGERMGFLKLMERIVEMDGDFSVRMLYMHPDRFDDDIVSFAAGNPGKVIPYFDLAFQHGSDSILALMGRKRSSQDCLRMIGRIRDALPDAVVRSSFLLGFPGENRSTLAELEDFIRQARLEYCGFFSYSREKGTRAYSLSQSRLSKKALGDEMGRLREVCDSLSEDMLSRFSKRRMRAILEEETDEGTFLGRLPFQAPEVDGICEVTAMAGHKAGDVVLVEIDGMANEYDFCAREVE